MTWKIRRSGTVFYVLEGQTVRSGPHADRALAEASIATLDPRPLYTQTGWRLADLIDADDADADDLLLGTVPDYLEFTELATIPNAPAIDRARLFARDSGSETKLYVRIFGGQVNKVLDVPDTVKVVADDNGSFAFGMEADSAQVQALGRASWASGNAQGAATAAVRSTGVASFARGFAAGTGSTILASGIAAFAHGYAYTGASVTASGGGAIAFGYGYGSGTITASGRGAHAGGYTGGAGSTILASSLGGMAFGKATGGGDIRSISNGTFAFGTAYGGTIEAGYSSRKGCFAWGYARQFAGTARIRASRYGAMAFGYALASTGATSGTITASGYGSIAGGSAAASSGQTTQIRASGTGSFAMGYAMNTNGSDINASALGSMAHGGAIGVALTASGKGAHAFGYAKTNAITASGIGSGAFGYSTTAAIVASATNAFQFGGGTNSVALSLQIGAAGSGIHLHGGGAPGAPANGDVWNTGTLVVIRSDGVDITFDQGAAIANADGTLADITTKFNTLLGILRTQNLIAT